MVFAIFSYPARSNEMDEFPYRDFTAQAYVNNITTGYVDPINPIAAVKYGRGKITKTGERYEIGTYLGPSYAPRNAAQYFKKLECFCFKQQTLAAGETKRFPVVFVIDPDLPKFRSQT